MLVGSPRLPGTLTNVQARFLLENAVGSITRYRIEGPHFQFATRIGPEQPRQAHVALLCPGFVHVCNLAGEGECFDCIVYRFASGFDQQECFARPVFGHIITGRGKQIDILGEQSDKASRQTVLADMALNTCSQTACPLHTFFDPVDRLDQPQNGKPFRR